MTAKGAVSDGNDVTSYGVYAKFNSKIDFYGGVSKDSAIHCVRAQRSSTIDAETATVSGNGSGYAIFASINSSVNIWDGTLFDCGNVATSGAIHASMSSRVEAEGVSITNVSDISLYCQGSSIIDIPRSTHTNINQMAQILENSAINLRDSTLTDTITGTYFATVLFGSSLNCDEFDGASSGGVILIDGGTSSFSSATLTGARMSIGQSAVVNCDNLSMTGGSSNGILAQEGSTINAKDAVLTGVTGYGILANTGSRVNANGADVSGASISGIRAQTGAIVNASGITGTVTNTLNTLTADGIVFG
jgi:hypothetical protein